MALLDAEGDFLLEFDLAPETTMVGSWVAQGINNGNDAVETNAYTSSVTAVFGAGRHAVRQRRLQRLLHELRDRR